MVPPDEAVRQIWGSNYDWDMGHSIGLADVDDRELNNVLGYLDSGEDPWATWLEEQPSIQGSSSTLHKSTCNTPTKPTH
jgi:hypothetical protein